jgi:actin related protein 2/3 complex subunit 1A/1B
MAARPKTSAAKAPAKANEKSPLATNIVCHAWNHDQSQVAISPNSDEVWIFATNGSLNPAEWTKSHVLAEHDGFVGGIDWHGETNTIVTCGHDRNAYVWEFKNGEWVHALVILHISRAATSVKWSPDGKKFAVTSGAKLVPVCTFVEKQNWWGAKLIKKGFKSTVISVAWCVNGKFIVTGATDFKCRVHSAYVDSIDPSEDDGFGDIWPEQHTFGEPLAEFDQAQAWINAVSWSPDGLRIAFAGQGGTLSIAQVGDSSVQTINTGRLPFMDIKFLSDDIILAAGYDMNPAIFRSEGDGWVFVANVDECKEVKAKKEEGKRAAFSKFQGMATRGEGAGSSSKGTGTAITYKTIHQNCITSIQYLGGTRFSTAGIDGRLLFWDLSKSSDSSISSIEL